LLHNPVGHDRPATRGKAPLLPARRRAMSAAPPGQQA
jgi:hypothetical protein